MGLRDFAVITGLTVVLGLIVIGTSGSFAVTNTSAPLSGGDPIYMNYNNLGIQGDVTAVGHEKWIEINSFQWGVGRAISSPVGAVNREASAPSVSEIVITKVADKSSIPLIQESLVGRGVPVIIDFVKTTSTGNTVYLQYTLENVLISGYSTSSGGDNPTESISLNFNKFTIKSSSLDDTGKINTQRICYDTATARVC